MALCTIITVHAASSTVATPSNAAQENDSADAVASTAGVCKKLCRGSCCHFQDPSRECSGCNASMVCNPNAECYKTGSANAPADAGPASERCSPGCKDSGCEDFSTPEAECAGCDAGHKCHPGADRYDIGMGVREEL